MEETKMCVDCGKELPISQFSRNKVGILSMCKSCNSERRKKSFNKKRQLTNDGGGKYSDADFDGKTPREVQDILARAARWLNNYDGFTCEVSLRYEKKINLPIH